MLHEWIRGFEMTPAGPEVEITIVLSASADPKDETTPVGRVARELELTINPQHPGSRDPELQRYYVAFVDAEEAVRLAVEWLATLPGVEGAYVKAAGQPPI